MITARGVDYSFSRPNLDCLRERDFRFVVRYLSASRTSRKNITRNEFEEIRFAGLALVLVYQDGTSDMLKGSAEGKRDAIRARAQALEIGFPPNRPIYFALDQDTSGFDADHWGACKNYLDAASYVLGVKQVGVYGSYAAIQTLCPDYAYWGWQTYAWSRGKVSTRAHFRQIRNNVTICGGAVDLNEAYRRDFGQYPDPLKVRTVEIETKKDDDKLQLVQNRENGAALIVSGGNAILCVNDTERENHESQGLERIVVGPEQFKRYEALRADLSD